MLVSSHKDDKLGDILSELTIACIKGGELGDVLSLPSTRSDGPKHACGY